MARKTAFKVTVDLTPGGDQGALNRKSGLQDQSFLGDILPAAYLHFLKCDIKPEKRSK